jgi:hypothetical protein
MIVHLNDRIGIGPFASGGHDRKGDTHVWP